MTDNEKKLLNATEDGNLNEVKRLIELGTNVNLSGFNDWKPQSPLHCAAERGYSEICKLLLANGANVNAQNKDGLMPLHYAAEYGHTGTCKLLLEYGADVNAKDKDGWMPLHYAARVGHTDICKLLLNNGADVNAKDKNGYTPLHSAAMYGHTDICKLLIDKGANTYCKDNDGRTIIDIYGDEKTKKEIMEYIALKNTIQTAEKQTADNNGYEWEY